MLITPQRSCGNELPALCTALQAHKMQRPTWMRAPSQGSSLKVLLPTHHTYPLPTKMNFPCLCWSRQTLTASPEHVPPRNTRSRSPQHLAT